MTIRFVALPALLTFVSCALIEGSARAASNPAPLTRARLESLKSSANDPAGDALIDNQENLGALVDAFVADNSLASPMYLYLAANTAFRLGRVEDSAFLFYAAQLRKAFDFKRYDIASQSDGNNAATYLSFLNQTIGQSVNPAIMGQPKLFASAIRRIEAWELVPSSRAWYPEFQEAKGFKLKAAEWPATAKALKQGFLDQFGRRYTTLLGDPQYFEALQFVQGVNFGRIDGALPKNQARMAEMMERIKTIEHNLDQASGVPPAPAPNSDRAIHELEQALAKAKAAQPKATRAPPAKVAPIDGGSLVVAAIEGRADVVERLLAAGVPVDAPMGGDTALFASVRNEHFDLAATLLKAGANAKVKYDNGDAPLISLARYCDQVELVRTFIKLGADVNTTTTDGRTPLKVAELRRCQAIAQELRRAGAKE